jgi:hypothetical protein
VKTKKAPISRLKAPELPAVVVPKKDSNEYKERFRVGQIINGQQICGANKGGLPCHNIELRDNGRCAEHHTPSGIAHSSYKHGNRIVGNERYKIPHRLYERYLRAAEDEDYLDNAKELHILTAQIDELNYALHEDPDVDPKDGPRLRREIREVIKLRARLTETQLKHVAHRDQHISYLEAMAMAKMLQDITRSLAFAHFKEEARAFLTELQDKWAGVLFNV